MVAFDTAARISLWPSSDRARIERAIPPGEIWRPSVPASPAADGSGTCNYRIETDGLIGSTRIDFVRE